MTERELEQLADRVADKVAERVGFITAPRLLTAGEVAERLGVKRGWVYANASALGAVSVGRGPRGRLRFDAATLDRALTARSEGKWSRAAKRPPSPGSSGRKAVMTDDGCPLLPVGSAPVMMSGAPIQERPGGAATPPAVAHEGDSP